MICHDCNKEISKSDNGGTGYGTVFETGDKICYACCAKRDIEQMKESSHIILYLTWDKLPHTISNWPGTLSLHALVSTKSNGHNWGLTRRDVWFKDPHGNHWHGVQYGDNTQLTHCKKLKYPVPYLKYHPEF